MNGPVKYKVIGMEPWFDNNQIPMTRLYCVTQKEGCVGMATIGTSIRSDRLPPDVTLNSYVLLGFERQGKYLEFVYVLPDESSVTNN